MSNSYLQFSEELAVTDEQEKWFNHLFVGRTWNEPAFPFSDADKAIRDFVVADEGMALCKLTFRTDGSQRVLHFSCDEYCDLEQVGRLLQCFLKTWKRLETFYIRFAEWSDKLRPGEFGGGVIAATAENFVIVATRDLVDLADVRLKEEADGKEG